MSFNFRALCRFLARPVAALVLAASLPVPVAQAGMVPTDRVLEEMAGTETAGQGERAEVQQFLAREDVQRELEAMGVDPAEARARVDSLSDAEVSRLAEAIRQDPAGTGALGTVVGAIVLIFLVLLVTDILGFTKVFPFTRTAN